MIFISFTQFFLLSDEGVIRHFVFKKNKPLPEQLVSHTFALILFFLLVSVMNPFILQVAL